ncbi:hypothetical protein ANRL1_04570 [Anaerolineae bacterium]|nr:hypothetical protein ANRL1_04570 [Anaerolineae bacterium]
MTQLHSAIEFSTNQYELRAEFSRLDGKNVYFELSARPIAHRHRRSSVANVNGIMGDLLDALELSEDEGMVQFEESDWVLSERETNAIAERIFDWAMASLSLKAGEVYWIDEALDADRAEGEWEER